MGKQPLLWNGYEVNAFKKYTKLRKKRVKTLKFGN